MEKVFVTGGSGFLGINLIRKLLEKGYEVISLDLLPIINGKILLKKSWLFDFLLISLHRIICISLKNL